MADVVRELRAFKKDFDDYAAILTDVWRRAPGHGWFGAAIPAERQRIEELRADLVERYGGLHDAIVEARGSEPIVEAAGIVGGDVFHLAFADPSDNPWLSDALDLAPQSVLQAIGYHRMRQSGRLGRVIAVVYREVKDWARIVLEFLAHLVRPG